MQGNTIVYIACPKPHVWTVGFAAINASAVANETKQRLGNFSPKCMPSVFVRDGQAGLNCTFLGATCICIFEVYVPPMFLS